MDMSKDMGAEERGGPLGTRDTQTTWTGESNGQLRMTGGSPTDGVGVRLIVTLDTKTNQRIFRFAEQSEQLLPGISDEITLDHICTKLPWTAFHILSGVSVLWKQAIRNRRVYDARVRANSTETLVVLQHERWPDPYGIALYSLRENRWYPVPGISHFTTRFQGTFKSIAMDGKIYIVGGEYRSFGNDVYELDLAGQKKWEKCGVMRGYPNYGLVLEVLDGKIYACGNSHIEETPVCKGEVYNPDEDFWSSISCMSSFRFNHHLTTLGGELFAYGGSFYEEEVFKWQDCRNSWTALTHDALFLEVYNPGQNKWRVVEPFGLQGLQRLFVVGGTFHLMTSTGVYVLDDGDVEKNVWTELHSFSLPLVDITKYDRCPTLAVDDELLTMCEGLVSAGDDPRNARKTCFLRTKGFGGKTKELVWEEVNCPLSFERDDRTPSLCLIHL